MGLLTQLELITEAGERAGDTGLATRLQVWIRTALDSLYAAKLWSFTRNRVSYTGAGTVIYLPEDGGLTTSFQLYDVDKAALYNVGNWVRDLDLVEPQDQASVNDPLFATAASTGQPQRLILEKANTRGAVAGQFTLRPSPAPDRSYTYAFDLYGVLSTELAYSASARPLYPVDETIIQALKVEIFGHMNDEREEVERGRLEGMIMRDAGRYAMKGRTSKALRLSPRKFGVQGMRLNTRFGWMGP